MRNPILIELTRGGLVESAHAGVVAVARADGTLAAGIGDVAAPVFPRSAIKPLQALAFVASGAIERLGLGAEAIAIACGSHAGTARHVAVVERMLASAGLTPAALGCGAHLPFDDEAARGLMRSGARPSSLHHNCSGKHAGMLATAVHMGEPVEGYWLPGHPVQVRIRAVLEELSGCALTPEACGIDGCSVPNWAMPPFGLARAFARLLTGAGLSMQRAEHCARVVEACMGHPELIAGPGRFDTLVMQGLPGKLLIKGGAEGVVCGGLPELGLGFAIKIDDGAKRAVETAAAHVVGALHPEAGDMAPDAIIRNWRGLDVGRTRAAPALAAMLGRLQQ